MEEDRKKKAERFLRLVDSINPTVPRESSSSRRTIAERLRSHGVRVSKMHGSMYSETGMPDLLCRLYGRLVWVETKAGHRRLSKAQLAFRKAEHEAGNPVMVVRPADFRRPSSHGPRVTPSDPVDAVIAILTFALDPKRAVELVEREWS